jgi:hypothetical protein
MQSIGPVHHDSEGFGQQATLLVRLCEQNRCRVVLRVVPITHTRTELSVINVTAALGAELGRKTNLPNFGLW